MKKIQDIYKSLGEYGCLLLCYLHEANIDVNIAKYFNELVEMFFMSMIWLILLVKKVVKLENVLLIISLNLEGN